MKKEERYKFTSKDIIGEGRYGRVYKALDLKTKDYVAIKEIF